MRYCSWKLSWYFTSWSLFFASQALYLNCIEETQNSEVIRFRTGKDHVSFQVDTFEEVILKKLRPGAYRLENTSQGLRFILQGHDVLFTDSKWLWSQKCAFANILSVLLVEVQLFPQVNVLFGWITTTNAPTFSQTVVEAGPSLFISATQLIMLKAWKRIVTAVPALGISPFSKLGSTMLYHFVVLHPLSLYAFPQPSKSV